MKRLLSVFFLLVSFLGPSARAAEITDLGRNLGYLRVHSLDEAVKPLAGNHALVLDLRRTTATSETVAAFSSALASRPAGTRLFILVSPDTPAALAAALKGNLLTLGIKGSRPEPQVIIAQTGEDDRRAYDALSAGTALADLISGKIEKERFDEASLVQEFKNGLPVSPLETAPSQKSEGDLGRLTDRVLQRAVHLHRALLALNSRH